MVTERPTTSAQPDGGHDPMSPYCPHFQVTVELLGRRWTGAIVRAMLAGRTRFSELTATVPGLTDRLLSARLKELEAMGLVRREVAPTTPVRVEYHLTEDGLELAEAVRMLGDWANRHTLADLSATG